MATVSATRLAQRPRCSRLPIPTRRELNRSLSPALCPTFRHKRTSTHRCTTMSYQPSRRTTFIPSSSANTLPSNAHSAQYTSAISARIAETKQELEALIQLRDLSANFAAQMEQLQTKLSTLVDGTEAVALVLSNWDSILYTLNMASKNLVAREERRSSSGRANEAQSKQELPEKLVRVRIDKD
ncbi:DASH complex subunit Dad2-domain-containing protein [Limtongia smithiae]|uniref:DASH complex subunit Dad2-domain-containing protein n=1 Tax=Limtongia smithiae TaxID=1125753 RepID=UPI0034CDF836